jgi:hypothetical protein
MRGKVGTVERVLGVHVFADSNALGRGEDPRWLYTVAVQGSQLWPDREDAEEADTLAQRIAAAQAAGDPDRGDTYYQHWLAALEDLVARKGATTAGELASVARAWESAAHRTPHGSPIDLRDGDFQA